MPISISANMDGGDEINREFGEFERTFDVEDSGSGIRKTMWRAVLRIQSAMQVYPPALPNSSYVRTGTLGRRWASEVTSSGDDLTGRVGNNTEYAPEVQSDEFQRNAFRNRWTTDKQVIEREGPTITREFEDLVRDAVREFGT